jgi:hypothetical protein
MAYYTLYCRPSLIESQGRRNFSNLKLLNKTLINTNTMLWRNDPRPNWNIWLWAACWIIYTTTHTYWNGGNKEFPMWMLVLNATGATSIKARVRRLISNYQMWFKMRYILISSPWSTSRIFWLYPHANLSDHCWESFIWIRSGLLKIIGLLATNTNLLLLYDSQISYRMPIKDNVECLKI